MVSSTQWNGVLIAYLAAEGPALGESEVVGIGLDRKRRVAVNGVKFDGSVADATARLWPQTERIRAYLIDRHEGDEARLRETTESLSRYLDAPLPGLWYENLAADGQFVVEAAPATSLYHIVGAIGELWACFGAQTALASQSD
jgi:mannose-6-phosphate isomerase